MRGVTDIPGVLVGHATDLDALTGCTVLIFQGGAVAGCDIRGSATGTVEFNLLDPLHVTNQIHALVFAGGSAFGLEAPSGVRDWLESKGVGFETGFAKVPLVPGAILYDLGIGKANVRPTKEMGAAAARAAKSGPVPEGAVGAGTGATVGKVFGMKQAMKSGIGTYTVTLGGNYKSVMVSALAAVNALGDIVDPRTREIIAGTRTAPDSRTFANSAEVMMRGPRGGFPAAKQGPNTTLVAVVTNAALTKVQATKLAQLGQHGLVRAISPVHTMSDGDLVVACSLGREHADVDALGVAAGEAVAQAIVRAVRMAPSVGGLPGLAG